jgi:hypothetical protein
MSPYTPLWKRGARGDFLSIILKSPFIPLCQRGIKTPVNEEYSFPHNINKENISYLQETIFGTNNFFNKKGDILNYVIISVCYKI